MVTRNLMDKKTKEKIFDLALEGHTRREILQKVGFDEDLYKMYYVGFNEAMSAGRAQFLDDETLLVTRSLLVKAKGYEKELKKFKTKLNAEGEPEFTEETTETRHYPPSDKAIEFFLVNRSRISGKNEWNSVSTLQKSDDSEKAAILTKLGEILMDGIEKR